MKLTTAGQPDTPTCSVLDGEPFRLPAIGDSLSNTVCPPQLNTAREKLAWEEFIVGVGPLTRIAYARAVRRLAEHLEAQSLTFASATPRHIATYIETLEAKPGHGQHGRRHPAGVRTRKQHLAAVRHFYHHLVQRHGAIINPAASVRSPRLAVERGETIAIAPESIRQMLAAIDTATFIGQRDHAIITTLSHTAARVGAIAKLFRGSVRLDTISLRPRGEAIILEEKNAKRRQLPLAGELRAVLMRWLLRLGLGDLDGPLFPTLCPNRPVSRPMTGQDILRMVRRRMRAAGVGHAGHSCHSFRAGTATALLESGLELSRVQDLLGHADPRTTRMYDARSREVQGETLDRIASLLAG